MVVLLLIACAWSVEGLTLRSAYPVALRAGHPVLLALTLSRSDALLVSGRLRLVVSDGPGERLRWTSAPWTLSRERTSSVVLPVIPGDPLMNPHLTAEFLHDHGEPDDLGELLVLPQANRVLMLAGNVSLGRSLALERLVPGEGNWRTAILPISLDALPDTLLGWSAADVVAVDAAALTALPQARAEGLRRWVRAGGSLVVAGALPAEWAGAAAGLGVIQATTSATDEPRWRTLAAAAWGLDAQRRQDFIAGKAAWQGDDRLHPQVRRGVRSDDLIKALWPSAMGRVPVGTVLWIFALFVLVIGPGEWLLLGRIRRRRWTWITFPLTTAAATWATLLVAQQALGGTDHHRRLRLIDASPSGAIWRTADYDLRILGAGRLLSDTPGDALWQPLPARAPRGRYRSPSDEGEQAVWVESTVERNVSQWSPVLSVSIASSAGTASPQNQACSYDAPEGDWATAVRTGNDQQIHFPINDNDYGRRPPWATVPEHPDEIAGIGNLIRPPTGRLDRPGRLQLSYVKDADGLIVVRQWTFTDPTGF